MNTGTPTRPVYDLLYIEDRQYDLEVVRAVLKDRNHRIRFNSVPSTVEACAYVNRTGRYADAPLADLVIIDIRDLDVSGIECVAYMRRNRIWNVIPIVALVSNEEQVEACYELHVNACVSKPEGLEELARIILAIHDFWLKLPLLPPPEPRLRALLAEFDQRTCKPGGTGQ